MSGHPLWLNPVFTAEGYEGWARQWIYGEGLNPDVFRQSLAVHVWISALFFISNASHLFVYVAQAALVSAACAALSYWASLRISSRWGGWSGILCACSGPLLFYAFQFGPGVWVFLGCVLLLIAFDVLEQRRYSAAALVTGILIGLVGAFHPALWSAGIGAFLAISFSRSVFSSAEPSLLQRRYVLAGLAVPVLALCLVTYVQTGVFTPAPVSDAAALYLPNHNGPCDARYPRPGLQQERFARWLRINDAFTHRAQRAFVLRQSWNSFRAEPGVWLRAMLGKGAQILCGREPGGELSPYVAREYSGLQRVLLWRLGGFGFPWGVLMPMALVGLIMRGRRWPVWFHGLWVGYALAGMVFSVTSSYRLGLLPIVAVGAVSAIDAVVSRIRRKAWPAVGGVLLLIGVLAAGFSLPGPFCSERVPYDAAWRVAVGQRLLNAGRMDEAEGMFRDALLLEPENPMTLNGLANIDLARGDDDAAEGWLREALAMAPDYALAWFNLAVIERDRGNDQGAIDAFRRGLLFHPWRGQAHFDLGRLLEARGEVELAMEHYQIAMQLDPTIPAPALAYAHALYTTGSPTEALTVLQGRPTWVTTLPEWAWLHGQVLFAGGHYHDALLSYMLVLDMGYQPRRVHKQLAAVYEALGNRERAEWHASQSARTPD